MCRICSKTNLSLQHYHSLGSVMLELTLAWLLAEKPEWLSKRSHHILPRSHSPLCTRELHTGVKDTLRRGSGRDFTVHKCGGEGLGEEAEPNICLSAQQSHSLGVTLNMCQQQHSWKTHSAVRIMKPTHLAGVGEASPPQRFVTVRAQRTCHREWGLCKRSSAEISTAGATSKKWKRDCACLWKYLIQDHAAPNKQKKPHLIILPVPWQKVSQKMQWH